MRCTAAEGEGVHSCQLVMCLHMQLFDLIADGEAEVIGPGVLSMPTSIGLTSFVSRCDQRGVCLSGSCAAAAPDMAMGGDLQWQYILISGQFAHASIAD